MRATVRLKLIACRGRGRDISMRLNWGEGDTYDGERKDVVAETDPERARELRDGEREGRDREDRRGLQDGLHHAPPDGAQLRALRPVLAHGAPREKERAHDEDCRRHGSEGAPEDAITRASLVASTLVASVIRKYARVQMLSLLGAAET